MPEGESAPHGAIPAGCRCARAPTRLGAGHRRLDWTDWPIERAQDDLVAKRLRF